MLVSCLIQAGAEWYTVDEKWQRVYNLLHHYHTQSDEKFFFWLSISLYLLRKWHNMHALIVWLKFMLDFSSWRGHKQSSIKHHFAAPQNI
jgi:hypothetical protein